MAAGVFKSCIESPVLSGKSARPSRVYSTQEDNACMNAWTVGGIAVDLGRVETKTDKITTKLTVVEAYL